MKLIIYDSAGKQQRYHVRSIKAGHDFAKREGDHVIDYEIFDDKGKLMYTTKEAGE